MLKYKITGTDDDTPDFLLFLEEKLVAYIENLNFFFGLRLYDIYDCLNDEHVVSITLTLKYIIPYKKVTIFEGNEKSNFFIGGLSFKTIIVGQDKYVYKSMKNAECVIYKNEKIALKKTRPYGGLGHVRESGCYLYIDEGENVFVLLSILLCLDFDFYRDSFRE